MGLLVVMGRYFLLHRQGRPVPARSHHGRGTLALLCLDALLRASWATLKMGIWRCSGVSPSSMLTSILMCRSGNNLSNSSRSYSVHNRLKEPLLALSYASHSCRKRKFPILCGYLHNDSDMARISAHRFSMSRRDRKTLSCRTECL